MTKKTSGIIKLADKAWFWVVFATALFSSSVIGILAGLLSSRDLLAMKQKAEKRKK